MNSPSHAISEPSVFHVRTAAGLGWSLVAALALVLLLTLRDYQLRPQLERSEQVTAVGDQAFFRPPEISQKPPAAVTVFRGQPLYPVSFKPVEVRDTKMLVAGEDDARQLRIYTSREPVPPQEGEIEKKDESVYFLKLAPGEYLKVRPSTPEK